jgi:hypothetical protein
MSRRKPSPEELAARAEWTAACDAAEELRRQAEELSRQHDAALGRYHASLRRRDCLEATYRLMADGLTPADINIDIADLPEDSDLGLRLRAAGLARWGTRRTDQPYMWSTAGVRMRRLLGIRNSR